MVIRQYGWQILKSTLPPLISDPRLGRRARPGVSLGRGGIETSWVRLLRRKVCRGGQGIGQSGFNINGSSENPAIVVTLALIPCLPDRRIPYQKDGGKQIKLDAFTVPSI